MTSSSTQNTTQTAIMMSSATHGSVTYCTSGYICLNIRIRFSHNHTDKVIHKGTLSITPFASKLYQANCIKQIATSNLHNMQAERRAADLLAVDDHFLAKAGGIAQTGSNSGSHALQRQCHHWAATPQHVTTWTEKHSLTSNVNSV